MIGERGNQGSFPQSLYRLVPSVNELLLSGRFACLLEAHPREAVVQAIRKSLADVRQEIASGLHSEASLTQRLELLTETVGSHLERAARFSLRRVINATGVILHTNLGRAPLSKSALEHVAEVAAGYANLELDLDTGERSRRDVHAESRVLRLLAAVAGTTMRVPAPDDRAVIVVNNCAAATFLALNTLADGGEVVVSRGELVEIGGGFRVPEILAKSGARLREVGTTNRTRVSDYEAALSSYTKLILRVHQSNFSMEGFTERPPLEDLLSLRDRTGVLLFEDQGTGLVSPLEGYGFRNEDSLLESYRQGVDLVAASGDKLLGGPQCGLLIGRSDLIERIRQNPLLRTFRVDKLTYAALEATLSEHFSGQADSIPLFRMLKITPPEILRRAESLVNALRSSELSAEIIPAWSVIGGGTTPKARLQSYAVALRHSALRTDALLRALRHLEPPVIGRISDDRVLLDLRTVEPEIDATLAALLAIQFEGSSPREQPAERP